MQEYFAAKYLVDNPGYVAENLAVRLLDTTWREPIVLAVGMVSQRRYFHSLLHLTEVFEVLLKTPDPAGDFLPHRELLAAAACTECERIPLEYGRQIADKLLALYTQWEGRAKIFVLRTRIQGAFTILRDSPARREVEAVLCDALQSPEFESRYAALDIIIETKWDSSDVAEALVAAWCKYPDPAASLLTALDEMSSRHSAYFQPDFLPLRQALMTKPLVWKQISANQEWKAVIHALYLPIDADFTVSRINRDSPLTAKILSILQHPYFLDQLPTLCQHLRSLACQLGTAEARDAILALSALGHKGWIATSVAKLGKQRKNLPALFACLTRFSVLVSSLVSTRAHVLDRDLYSTFGRIFATDLAHARSIDFDLAYGRSIARELDLASDLEEDNILLDGPSEIDRAFAFVFDQDLDFQHDLFIDKYALYADNPENSNTLALWDLATAHSLAKAQELELDNELSQDMTHDILALEDIRLRAGHLADNPSSIKNLNLIFAFDRTLVRASDLALASTLASELANKLDQDYSLDLPFLRAIDIADPDSLINASALTRAKDLVHVLTSIYESDLLHEIERHLLAARAKFIDSMDLLQTINAALTSVQTMQRIIGTFTVLTQTWTDFMMACIKQRPTELKPSSISSAASDVSTSYSLQTLIEILMADLISHDDVRRERARKLLVAKRSASMLGQSTIGMMAKLMLRYANHTQIAAQLDWALKEIVHDTPSWITEWIAQAGATDRVTAAEIILCRIHYVTPETFETILKILPNTTFYVKMGLFKSISWLARLGRIPRISQAVACKQLLGWLDHETKPEIRSAIADLLGYWQTTPRIVSNKLLACLNTTMDEVESAALYRALARLAVRHPDIRELVRAELYRRLTLPLTAAALTRLNIVEARQSSEDEASSILLKMLDAASLDPSQCLIALLDAGIEDDVWDKEYHGILVNAACTQLELHPDLLPVLLKRLKHALEYQTWESCRIVLGVVAACIEVMPIAVQRAYRGDLEASLVKGAMDARSQDSRCFALTALSYLRNVSQAVVLALLAGCKDIEVVQQAAVAAAGRFQSVRGDLSLELAEALSGDSVTTAYTVAHLLCALGISTVGEASRLRRQIIEALVKALKNPKCKREVVISGENKGKLEEILYVMLLQVAGWPA